RIIRVPILLRPSGRARRMAPAAPWRSGAVKRLTILAVLTACAALAPLAAGPEAGPDLAHDEAVLRDAPAGLDGPALPDFFRQRPLSAADRERLAGLVADLGSDDFGKREAATRDLLLAGRAALPFLKPALAADDLEVSRRAREVVQAIESGH